MNGEIFCAPRQRYDGASGQSGGEIRGKRKAQVWPALLHGDDPRALEYRLQAAPDGFYLGKLRHLCAVLR